MAALPETMTAIDIPEPGGPEVLVPAARPVPKPGLGEVLIKVAAAGVNRPDVAQRQGGYPPPPGAPDIPGLEVAGEIVGVRVAGRVAPSGPGRGRRPPQTGPASVRFGRPPQGWTRIPGRSTDV